MKWQNSNVSALTAYLLPLPNGEGYDVTVVRLIPQPNGEGYVFIVVRLCVCLLLAKIFWQVCSFVGLSVCLLVCPFCQA